MSQLICSFLALLYLVKASAIFGYIVHMSFGDGKPIKRSTSTYFRGCYYTNWSQYRPGLGKFMPENYQSGLCTHIFYAFVVMNDDFTLKAFEWNDEDSNGQIGMYTKVNSLKQQQPDLKTFLSFGGYTFSQDHAALIRKMLTNATNRRTFIDNAIAFVRRTGFDGFDLDYEYPDWGTKGSFSKLVQELREAVDNESQSSGRPKLLLAAAVAAGIERISGGYNGKILAECLDIINVMTYDFHGAWEAKTGFSSPLYDRNGDRLSASTAMTYWNTNQHVPKQKLMMGFGAYGRGWTLASASSSTVIGSPTNGAAPAQPFTRENGIASYYEICNLIENGHFVSQYDTAQRVPFVYKDTLWYGYDDVKSFNEKLDWLIENGYGGAFVWSLDLDDFSGRCVSSAGVRFPLISAIRTKLQKGNVDQSAAPISSTAPITPRPNVIIPTLSTTPTLSSTTANPKSNPVTFTSLSPPASTNGPFRCPEPGLYPDSTSCTNFYQCDDAGIAYKMTCPAGLHFSKDSLVCDWPYNAGCSDTTTTVSV